MFFSRDSKVFIAPLAADGAEAGVWEIPVLDGFSFLASNKYFRGNSE